MGFPYWIDLGVVSVHPHIFFEFLGYLAGISVTLWVSESGRDSIPPEQRHPLIVAGLLGALVGAKLLAWAQHPQTTMLALTEGPAILFGGKTIVGGLLGGMTGIELAKKSMGIESRTGDPLVLPLAVGMSIGRLGCFFSGLDDATYGVATSLPVGVDFGDGVSRHPTQLYEIFAIWGIYFLAKYRSELDPVPQGWRFRSFLMGYLVWRLLVDWIKPTEWEIAFLSPIQIACVLGLVWYLTLGKITEEEWGVAGDD